MIDLNNTAQLNDEWERVYKDFNNFHAEMQNFNDYYNKNVFYAKTDGTTKASSDVQINFLKVFADKNVHYTSPFPNMKVLPSDPDPEQREMANIREKILMATHRQNNTPLKQRTWSRDGTIRAMAVSDTYFDIKNRCVRIERLDPRFVYWQRADDMSDTMIATWVAFPMTADMIERRYGIKRPPQGFKDRIDPNQVLKGYHQRKDDREWHIVIKRYDDKRRVAWVGDTFIEEPHNHKMGVNPIDIVEPFPSGELTRYPDFYLRPLLDPQAEYNYTLHQISNIARKLGNPAIWGRGIMSRHFEEIKRTLAGDGGFVGLKANGELGVLQIPETKMLSDHLDMLFQSMKYLSGFGNASFGESVGANTSGDALSMYFQPTTRSVDDQMVAWQTFYESINSKVLRLYETFLKRGEEKTLTGVTAKGTLLGIDANVADYRSGGYSVTFTKEDIDGNYDSVVMPKSATPKDEVAYKRLIMDAVSAGFLSRRTAYEEFGILSPEDELQILEQEQSNPSLNPEGMSQLIGATQQQQEPQDLQQLFDQDAEFPQGVANELPVSG